VRVYGQRWVRQAYVESGRRYFVWLLARRAFFSQRYGIQMKMSESALRILPFISKSEHRTSTSSRSRRSTTRRSTIFLPPLKARARPIAPGDDVAVCPPTRATSRFRISRPPRLLREGVEVHACETAPGVAAAENSRTARSHLALSPSIISPVSLSHRVHALRSAAHQAVSIR